MTLVTVIADTLSWALIILGAVSMLIGGIGVLRFPDVYTRMHAASITDTLGAGALLLGLTIQAGFTLVAVKLLLMLVFLFFTSPTSSFSLAHAALSSGVDPMLDADLRGDAGKDQETRETSS
jgi:multicomponent Na+:H+ antiporter subunit G